MDELKELWEADELPEIGAYTNRIGGGRYLLLGFATDRDSGQALCLYAGPCEVPRASARDWGWEGPNERRADAVIEWLEDLAPPSPSSMRAQLRDLLAGLFVDDPLGVVAVPVAGFTAAFEKM